MPTPRGGRRGSTAGRSPDCRPRRRPNLSPSSCTRLLAEDARIVVGEEAPKLITTMSIGGRGGGEPCLRRPAITSDDITVTEARQDSGGVDLGVGAQLGDDPGDERAVTALEVERAGVRRRPARPRRRPGIVPSAPGARVLPGRRRRCSSRGSRAPVAACRSSIDRCAIRCRARGSADAGDLRGRVAGAGTRGCFGRLGRRQHHLVLDALVVWLGRRRRCRGTPSRLPTSPERRAGCP